MYCMMYLNVLHAIACVLVMAYLAHQCHMNVVVQVLSHYLLPEVPFRTMFQLLSV